ncbi:MAG: sensor histidine kinase [Lachnospiraceae bacterium]|nr:sensor histidine kinase [Lachnospiraceae bacterium]
MVLLLKHRNTVKDWLLQYLFQVCSITVLLVAMVLVFSLYMNRQFTHSTQQLLTLNDMFVQLDEVQDTLYEYTWYGDEEAYQAMQTALREESTVVQELLDMKLTTGFWRDMLDIEQMLLRYQECIETIWSAKQQAYEEEQQEEILTDSYECAMDIYTAINTQTKSLYSQMISSVRVWESRQQTSSRICIGLFLLLLAEMIFIEVHSARKLSEKIMAPIQVLTEGAKRIECSNLMKIELGTLAVPEEMALLVRVFNSMIERIETQVQEIRERAKDRELLRTSQLRALQMQMNPHFLFNTLTMIANAAYMDHSERTVTLLEQTADLLRYSLDYADKAVTLEKELESLGCYVYLQEQRFGKRIRFIFDLDESFHQIHMPSLILQPLVENAVVHGVGMRQMGGEVRIATYYEEEGKFGVLEVTDNGEGLDDDELYAVIEQMKKGAEDKIGLANVYARLQIFFDGAAEMEFRSRKKEGTMVRILLPCDRMTKSGADE